MPIDLIDVGARARPVCGDDAERLAWDIEARGLRQPIEVAKQASGPRGLRYRLVSGAHRLEAFRRLRRETIPAVIITGKAAALRRDELLENLVRRDLTALERAASLAGMKAVYLEENPDARRGGDRKSTDFTGKNQTAKLAV